MSLEEDIKRCKELIKEEHSSWLGITNQVAIKNVLSELERLKEENSYLKNHFMNYECIKLNYISKDTIRKKIDKLEKQIPDKIVSAYTYDLEREINLQIQTLEELLEESEEN